MTHVYVMKTERGWQYQIDGDRWDSRVFPTDEAAIDAAKQELADRGIDDRVRVQTCTPFMSTTMPKPSQETEIRHTRKVVTWTDPRGHKINICERCQEKLEEAGTWPRNAATGEQYCQVSFGLHRGECDVTEEREAQWAHYLTDGQLADAIRTLRPDATVPDTIPTLGEDDEDE